MKQIKLFSAVLAAMLISSAAIFNACCKQENIEQTTNPEAVYMNAADIQFQNELVKFREKVNYSREHPSYKSGEVMDADSAILHIETLFNATYSFADEHYAQTQTDRATVLIDVNNTNEDVLFVDVVTTFDEIINIVTQFYNQCSFQQKGFILLDLKKGIITGNQVEIELRSVIGERSGDWNPFGSDDCWWYGEHAGDCDLNNGGYFDAAVKIMEMLNVSRPLVSAPSWYRYTYDNYEEINLFGHEYENENGEKLIFYIENANNNFTLDEYQVEPEEMNFYFNGEEEVIYNILPDDFQKPSNWVFMVSFLDGLQEANPYNDYMPTIHHQNKLTYAYRHLVNGEILAPPVQLGDE